MFNDGFFQNFLLSSMVGSWNNSTNNEKICYIQVYLNSFTLNNFIPNTMLESLMYSFLETLKDECKGTAAQDIFAIQCFLKNPNTVTPDMTPMVVMSMYNFLDTLKSQPKDDTEQEKQAEKQLEIVTSATSSRAVIETVKCNSCGTVLERDSNFCKKCGTKIENNAGFCPNSTPTVVISPEEQKPEKGEMSQDEENAKARVKYVFHNVAIHQYESNVIYGEAKSYKSLLSIAIGNSDKIKKGLYILVDNIRGKDLPRYTEGLGEKAIPIGLGKIKEKVQEIKNRRESDAQSASFMMCNLLTNNHNNYLLIEGIIKRCYKAFGAEIDNPKPVNGFVAIEAIIDDAIRNENIDFICIDSLNKLFGGSKKIDDDKISQLIQIAGKENITLLCVHHTNAQGKLAGTNAIEETFDNIYRLSRDTTYPTENTGEKSLILVEEYSRYSEEKSSRLNVTFGKGLNPVFDYVGEITPSELKSIHIQASQKRPNVSERIKAIISCWEDDTISFNELKTELGGDESPTIGAIKNSLKELSNMGFVKMTDAKTWDVITVLEPLKKK